MMLKVSNVFFHYQNNKEVLKDVSFEINKGECVVLLGPNGAGKSTLLSLILGANKAKKGEICIENKQIDKLSSKEKASYLSYVPQLLNGNDLTVRETILLGRLPYYKIYPNKNDFEKVDEMINKFNLTELVDKQTNEISGGERQKVNIARAFIQNSQIVVFDEPTSNLDIKSQVEILSMIKDEKVNAKRSFLISMHDINQALHIGDRFIFLKDGRIHTIATKEDITSNLIDEVYGVHSKIIKTDNGEVIIYEI